MICIYIYVLYTCIYHVCIWKRVYIYIYIYIAPPGLALRIPTFKDRHHVLYVGLWHSYPCPCPRQRVERFCRTNEHSRTFVELFRAGVWV